MRKIILSAALATSALALAACSNDAEVADETAAVDEVAVEEEAPAAEATMVMDASSATQDEIAALPGMTPELAAAVVAGQPYASITDLNAVLMESLTEEQAATVRETLFVPVNLNSATREQLELIPGIDDRMIHEFEEYVPYEDMAEFDREIGKYVDAAEVARYRNYVTL